MHAEWLYLADPEDLAADSNLHRAFVHDETYWLSLVGMKVDGEVITEERARSYHAQKQELLAELLARFNGLAARTARVLAFPPRPNRGS